MLLAMLLLLPCFVMLLAMLLLLPCFLLAMLLLLSSTKTLYNGSLPEYFSPSAFVYLHYQPMAASI